MHGCHQLSVQLRMLLLGMKDRFQLIQMLCQYQSQGNLYLLNE